MELGETIKQTWNFLPPVSLSGDKDTELSSQDRIIKSVISIVYDLDLEVRCEGLVEPRTTSTGADLDCL